MCIWFLKDLPNNLYSVICANSLQHRFIQPRILCESTLNNPSFKQRLCHANTAGLWLALIALLPINLTLQWSRDLNNDYDFISLLYGPVTFVGVMYAYALAIVSEVVDRIRMKFRACLHLNYNAFIINLLIIYFFNYFSQGLL